MSAWFACALVLACLFAWVWLGKRHINRDIEHFRRVEAERLARENGAPLGNVSRWFE